MPLPLLIMAGASLAGSIYSASQKQPKINYQEFIDMIRRNSARSRALIKSGSATERNFLKTYRGKMKGFLPEYQQRAQTELGKTIAGRKQLAERYRAEIASVTDPRIAKGQIGTLKEDIFGGLPEYTESLKEQLAASGGLKRGGAMRQLSRGFQDAARRFGRGATDIRMQELERAQRLREDTANKLFTLDESFLRDTLGINRQDALLYLQTGREDELNQFNLMLDELQNKQKQMLGVESSEQSSIAGLMGQKASGELARTLGRKRQQARLVGDIAGLVGSAAAFKYGGGQFFGAPKQGWESTGSVEGDASRFINSRRGYTPTRGDYGSKLNLSTRR